MILTLKDKVWWFALYSRVFVLITSAVFNFLLPDHPADAFITPKPVNNIQETYGDVVVRYLCGGLMRWDAQHFMHVAMYGYTYEHCLAFFPLYPLLCRAVTQVLYMVVGGVLSDVSLYMISSLFISVFCFIKSASVLYDLSLRVLRNESLAYKASIFYCVNPASIFFSAPYSESLYACLSFYGMLKCGCGFEDKFSVNCGIIFGLGAVTRSNGILNIGFIAYKCVKDFFLQALPKFRREMRESKIGILWMILVILMITGIFVLPYMISVVLSLFPFITFQLYGYQKFCIPHNHVLPDYLVTYAEANNFVLPGTTLPENNKGSHWCKNSFPFSYTYIQSHYWHVGFLRYYHWKQIPNFLLALPVVWIMLSESYLFILKYFRYCLYLGLQDSLKVKQISFKEKVICVKKATSLPEDIFPYVIHALFLTIFSVLCAHVQVTTRLISSSSPLLYWYCAKISLENGESKEASDTSKLSFDLTKMHTKKTQSKRDFVQYNIESLENVQSYWKVFILDCVPTGMKSKFILLYFLLFMFVGTILFSNFLPWT